MVDRYCKVRDQCVEPPGLCTRRVRNGKEERRQEMKIVYDSRSKEFMISIGFTKLRILSIYLPKLQYLIIRMTHYFCQTPTATLEFYLER